MQVEREREGKDFRLIKIGNCFFFYFSMQEKREISFTKFDSRKYECSVISFSILFILYVQSVLLLVCVFHLFVCELNIICLKMSTLIRFCLRFLCVYIYY